MPKVAQAIDEWKSVLPDIKVLYAEEGSYSMGKKPNGVLITPILHIEEEKKGRKK